MKDKMSLLIGTASLALIGRNRGVKGNQNKNLEPINPRNRIIAMLDEMVLMAPYDGPLYGRIAGAYGNHKLKLFGLEGYDKRAFVEAWKHHPLMNRISCSSTWCDLGGSNRHLHTGYSYKMYISVVLDGTPESVDEFVKIFGTVYQNIFRPFKDNPNDNVQIKFANYDTIMDHFDTIVVYSLNETVINEMYEILIENIPKWNEKLEHCRILTPAERQRLFVRCTLGADGPNHSDSSALSEIITKKYYQTRKMSRNELYQLLKDWAVMPPSDKIKIYQGWTS